jgi:hypothetical protein
MDGYISLPVSSSLNHSNIIMNEYKPASLIVWNCEGLRGN